MGNRVNNKKKEKIISLALTFPKQVINPAVSFPLCHKREKKISATLERLKTLIVHSVSQHKKTMMRIWVWLLCFVGLVCGQSGPDGAAMKALRDALNHSSALGDWSGDDPCKWTNVTCDSSHRVTGIQIKNKKTGVTGTLPAALNTLSSLVDFEVMDNSLTGEIPSFAGLTLLQTVFLHDNKFTSIAADFFTGLTSLRKVSLDNNPFVSWEIPLSLKDATSLVEFSAANCSISGAIPEFLGGQTFPSLQKLRLSGNSLVGELPSSFAGSPLQVLWLNGQSLNGSISVLQNMTNLIEVHLNKNQFSGPIPDLSGLVSLKIFNGRDNQLTGIVPSSFTEMESLSDVSLSNNLLQGPTPLFTAKLTPLEKDTINSFCLDTPGKACDPGVNTLLSIVEAFGYPVGFAQSWKGNDPCNGNWAGITCTGGVITVINFKNRGLTGIISPHFANLTGIQVIILSQNNLTGTIPQELVKLSNLKTLDVSNNHLYGKVPEFRPNVVNTNGNPDIGKDPPPGSPDSPSGDSGKKPSSNVGKIVGAVIGVLVVLLLIGFVTFFMIKKKRQYRKMRYASSEDQNALKITIGSLYAGSGSEGGLSSVTDHVVEPGFSIQVLRDATNNFDEKNMLGRGGFGIVYKGELRDGTKIAVKRMESSVISGKGLDEFKSEIAVLTRVRHRNLVVLHGFCLEANERLLVYQYMPQGTLSRFLFHWQEEGLKPLEWSRRLIIALDVARAVEYLHMLAHQSFIHRDLKPSNILLGDDMHAKVADFGLVRLAPEGAQSIETKIAGTFGYLAPEYAVTGRVTTKVDVYSFGVILMELLTGRKALDAKRSEEDVHLATWFRRMLINKDTFAKAIDETIGVNEEILGSINKVAELASYCSAREPQQRPDMSHVVNVLVSLIEQWKPAQGGGDIYGIDYDTHSTSLSLIQQQSFSMSSSGL